MKYKTLRQNGKDLKEVLLRQQKSMQLKSCKKKYKDTPWWTDRIKEAINRKNTALREWFSDRTEEKNEKY
jgi:hypothetical protein